MSDASLFFAQGLISDRSEDAGEDGTGEVMEEEETAAPYHITNLDEGKEMPTWWKGASGHEMAMGFAEGRPGPITAIRPVPTKPACLICQNPQVSAAIEPLLKTGNVDQCSKFLARAAPEMNNVENILQHMSHGLNDEEQCEGAMLKSLMVRSFNIAMSMGEEFGTNVVMANGQMCWPNRHNIAGFATASSVFVKLLQCKNNLDKKTKRGNK